MGIAYTYHFAHILFEYKLVLVILKLGSKHSLVFYTPSELLASNFIIIGFLLKQCFQVDIIINLTDAIANKLNNLSIHKTYVLKFIIFPALLLNVCLKKFKFIDLFGIKKKD